MLADLNPELLGRDPTLNAGSVIGGLLSFRVRGSTVANTMSGGDTRGPRSRTWTCRVSDLLAPLGEHGRGVSRFRSRVGALSRGTREGPPDASMGYTWGYIGVILGAFGGASWHFRPHARTPNPQQKGNHLQ